MWGRPLARSPASSHIGIGAGDVAHTRGQGAGKAVNFIRSTRLFVAAIAFSGCGGAGAPIDGTVESAQLPGPPRANDPGTVLRFKAPELEWSHAMDFGLEHNHIWLAGDSWAQTFAGTPLPSANHMMLTLLINGNSLQHDALTLKVLLNGIGIGRLTVTPEMLGVSKQEIAFAPIAGPDYRVEIRVAGGARDGCISIADNGTSFAVLRNVH